MHQRDINTVLKRFGLRRTKVRRAILQRFHHARTWTASQLAAELPKSDLSTIYRNLQKLVEKEVLVEVHSHDGESHYEQAGKAHHDHLVCESCDIVECVPCPAPKLTTHTLELIGTCSSCA